MEIQPETSDKPNDKQQQSIVLKFKLWRIIEAKLEIVVLRKKISVGVLTEGREQSCHQSEVHHCAHRLTAPLQWFCLNCAPQTHYRTRRGGSLFYPAAQPQKRNALVKSFKLMPAWGKKRKDHV